jgi:type II secretory pathway pseudopilin PulG
VIAIIAILIAILFPIFGTVREQARQSNTLSSLHSIYVACRQYNDDEGQMPPSLFGYAEVSDPYNPPPGSTTGVTTKTTARIFHTTQAVPPTTTQESSTVPVVPMDQTTNALPGNYLAGYLWNQHTKSYQTYVNSDAQVSNKAAVTTVYWPLNTPISQANGASVVNGVLENGALVQWYGNATATPIPSGQIPVGTGCSQLNYSPDQDNPDLSQMRDFPVTYSGTPKVFYTMDSMDIGPMLGPNGDAVKDVNNNTVYELHYTPDWTHLLGTSCDNLLDPKTHNWVVIPQQLKYQNPPADRTVITYVTQHTATSGSPSVIVLLLSGTARKVNYVQTQYPGTSSPTFYDSAANPPAPGKLPLGYAP